MRTWVAVQRAFGGMIMFGGLGSVATIFVMIGMGYFLAHRKLFNRATNKLFSKLVIQVSLAMKFMLGLKT